MLIKPDIETKNKANTYKSRARHKLLNWPDSLLYLFIDLNHT